MSLSASLSNVGRAVAYYPKLSRFFGSVNASLFFSQLYYWQSRTTDPDGVFKTADEWDDETGLSYREQVTARKILVDQGFLIEVHKRLQHRVYYMLDMSAIDAAFDVWNSASSLGAVNAVPQMRFRSSGSAENAFGGTTKTHSVNKKEITAEITAETTPQNQIGFASFWQAYPKKTAKPAALMKFKSAKLKAGELDAILTDIETRKQADDWTKENGKYVPNPATYLSQRRWEDGETAHTAKKIGGVLAGAI